MISIKLQSNTFSQEHLWRAASVWCYWKYKEWNVNITKCSKPIILLLYAMFSGFLWLNFTSNACFSNEPRCCLTFSWIELQMLVRCYLMHITTIILWPILYLVYLCPCLGLGLFMSYIFGLFFIFSLIFFLFNHIITDIITDTLVFAHFFEISIIYEW